MSKMYENLCGRKTKKQILELCKVIVNGALKTSIIDYKVPVLYEWKPDFWDLDLFLLLKDSAWGYSVEWIKDIIGKTGFSVEEIKKSGEAWTMLLKWKDEDYHHLDLFITEEKYKDKFYNVFFKYYEKPFFSYFFGIMMKRFGIKYGSKWVFRFESHKENWLMDVYIDTHTSLSDFIYYINKFSKDNAFIRWYQSISNYSDILKTLYSLSFFDYSMYEYSLLRYEEKRKIDDYETNKVIYDQIMKDQINNSKLERWLVRTCILMSLINKSEGFRKEYFKNKKYIKNKIETNKRKEFVLNYIFRWNNLAIQDIYKSNNEWKIAIFEKMKEDIENLDITVTDIINKYDTLFI